MGLFGKKKIKENKKSLPEIYDEAEFNAVDEHITKYFGKSETVFHELASPDIHVDVYICEPTEERPYYTLVTHGMGAHRMNVPGELAEYKLDRLELLVTLPKDWDVKSDDEKWYWPIRSLKSLARLPIENNTWLGYGHTVGSPDNYSYADSSFVCIMLTLPTMFDQDSAACELPNGDLVRFYQLMPLYKDEMDYKLQHDAETLEDLFGDVLPFVIDINRKSIVEE